MRLLSGVIALLGLGSFVLLGIMATLGPPPVTLPDGFQTPIIALEFARTETDLAWLSGGAAEEVRTAIRATQSWDTLFPITYGLFITLIAFQLARGGQPMAWAGVLFGVLIIPTDLYENMVIADILAALEAGDSANALLPGLYVATWLKWGAIGLAFGSIGVALLKDRGWFAGVPAMLIFAIYAVCFASNSQPALTELMSLSTGVFFLIFLIRAIVQTARGRPT